MDREGPTLLSLGDIVLNDDDPLKVGGNASENVKKFLSQPGRVYSHYLASSSTRKKQSKFDQKLAGRLALKEVSIRPRENEPLKDEGRLVYEMEVEQGECSCMF
jgi:hypothetical protein